MQVKDDNTGKKKPEQTKKGDLQQASVVIFKPTYERRESICHVPILACGCAGIMEEMGDC